MRTMRTLALALLPFAIVVFASHGLIARSRKKRFFQFMQNLFVAAQPVSKLLKFNLNTPPRPCRLERTFAPRVLALRERATEQRHGPPLPPVVASCPCKMLGEHWFFAPANCRNKREAI
jgi:hypothetical protein